MKSFREHRAGQLTSAMLKEETASRGYILIRNAVPKHAIDMVLNDVTHVLATAGWLRAGTKPSDRFPADGAAYGDPDPIFKTVYQKVFSLESFHALPHHQSLRKIMKALAGDKILIHPKPIGRLIFPRCERLVVRAHQDYEFMQGDPEFYTVWVPLHDCLAEDGALRILEGSHRFGIQRHQKENLHVPEISLGDTNGDDWVTGRVNAGDVLIFHGLTVHAANPNTSERIRLSLDCRFQDAHRTLHPSNLVFAGESGKSWEKTYANWRSDALQYYWRKLSLTLKPSREELERMAETAESPALQNRYARMAGQL